MPNNTECFEVIDNVFEFPFTPHQYQHNALTKMVDINRLILPLKVGRGKTPLSTWVALYQAVQAGIEHVIVLVPAPLVLQWFRWFQRISFKNGGKLDVLKYKGTPKEREQMEPGKHDIVIMSHQIFVRDYERIKKIFQKNGKVYVIYDESQDGLRHIHNQVWRKFNNFTINKRICLLSGTPVSAPGDVYGVVKLLTPEVYPTKSAFESRHVADVDFFGNITKWKDLEYMKWALYKNAVMIPDSELNELPGLTIDKVPYQLSKKHMELYDQLVDEELLEKEDGGVLDGTETNKLFHLLQRFVTSPDRMGFKKEISSELHNALWTLYSEDDSKLIVFSYYVDTNRGILDYFLSKKVKAVGVWGEIKNSQDNLDAFMQDPEVRVLVGNWKSMGVGTDGLQHVCFREIFAEMPMTPALFEQATGRIDREGQKEKCVAKCLVAEGTIQEALFHSFLKKDNLLQQITEGRVSLRDLLVNKSTSNC